MKDEKSQFISGKKTVIIINALLSGGAPRSLLQYALVLKKNGYNVYSAGQFVKNDAYLLYEDNGIPIYNIERIKSMTSLYKNYRLLINLYKMIISKKTSIIIANGSMDASIFSFIGKILGIPVIIVIAGGPPKVPVEGYKFWNNNHVICFSNENKKCLIDNGYNESNITVISNRIKVNPSNNYLEFYNHLTDINEKIIVLFASRLDRDKFCSIEKMLSLIEEISKYVSNVEFRIAGSGEYYDLIKQKVETINIKLNGNNNVILLGHINDIEKEYNKAHIVFGKGRSVIEALLYNKIGFVISEDKKVSLCDLESYENLYYYNFSGRNMQYDCSTQFIGSMLKELRAGEYDIKAYGKVFECVRESYHIDKLEDKLMGLINKYKANESIYKKTFSPLNTIRILFFLLHITFIRIKNKVSRKSE